LSAEIANNWYYELQDAIASLENFPNRCSKAPEASVIEREIRQLWVGKRRKYRVLFVVEDNIVAILHIRHSQQLSGITFRGHCPAYSTYGGISSGISGTERN